MQIAFKVLENKNLDWVNMQHSRVKSIDKLKLEVIENKFISDHATAKKVA
jgi:hypothetical protein